MQAVLSVQVGKSELASPALGGQTSSRPGEIKRELAPQTARLYAGDWTRFVRFCAEQGRSSALPAALDLVLMFLGQSGQGRAALARHLAAIDHKHRQFGLPPPGFDPRVRAALKAARKAAPRRARATAPTPDQLRRLAQSCPGDLAGRRDRALLLLASAGLSRKALVGLIAEGLRFTEHGVTLTDEPRSPLVVNRSAAIASCPVRALEDWLRVSATRFGPVFRKVNRWGGLEDVALGTDAVRLILARRTAELKPLRSR